MDGAIDVADLPTALTHCLDSTQQEQRRIGVRPLLVRVGEPLANISQSCGSQHGIGQRVQQNVRIAVTIQTEVVVDLDSTQYQRASWNQPVIE